MSRTFFYARVSTTDQNTDNQVLEAKKAGFNIQTGRTFTESISGSVPAFERPQFKAMLHKMEAGDVLVVSKLDRLGRNAIDVVSTVDNLNKDGIKVVCLALGGVDLTSPAGKLQLQVLAAVAQFERDLLIERTQAGLARVKAEGKKLGRKAAYTEEQACCIRTESAAGASVRQLGQKYGLAVGTIHKIIKNQS